MTDAEKELVREAILDWWETWIAEGKAVVATNVANMLIAEQRGFAVADVTAVCRTIRKGPWTADGLAKMGTADQKALVAHLTTPREPALVAPPEEAEPTAAESQPQENTMSTPKAAKTAKTPHDLLSQAQDEAKAQAKAATQTAAPRAVTKPAAKPAAVPSKAAAKPAAAKPEAANARVSPERPPVPDLSPTPAPENASPKQLKDWENRERLKAEFRENPSCLSISLPHKCPKAGCTVKAETMDELLMHFGCRRPDAKTPRIIQQSNCRACRQVASERSMVSAKAAAQPRIAARQAAQNKLKQDRLLQAALKESGVPTRAELARAAKAEKAAAEKKAAAAAKPAKTAEQKKADRRSRAREKAVAAAAAGTMTAADLKALAAPRKKKKPAVSLPSVIMQALKETMSNDKPSSK